MTSSKSAASSLSPRLPVLDSWRGICALSVALMHLNNLSHIYYFPAIRHASLCVDFFFLLSGFILRYVYFDRITTGPDAAAFLTRRFGRLWPLHIITTAVVFVNLSLKNLVVAVFHYTGANLLLYHGHTLSMIALSLIAQLFMIQGMGLWTYLGDLNWNFPSWSISVEFYAYWVFAALCFAPKSSRNWLALALSAMGGIILVIFNGAILINGGDLAFFRCLYSFFLGFILFGFYKKHSSGTLPGATFQECLATFLYLAFLWVAKDGPIQFLAPVVFGYVIYVFAFAKGAISRLLSTGPALALGAWSYSIYLLHNILIEWVYYLVRLIGKAFHVQLFASVYDDVVRQVATVSYFHSLWAGDLFSVVFAGVLLFCCSFSYRFIEVPARNYFNRKANAISRLHPGTKMQRAEAAGLDPGGV